MKRVILAAPVLAPAALAELKDWLGISQPGDDAQLSALLRAALETCEAYTGSLPLLVSAEESLDGAQGGWQALASCPVQAISRVEGVMPGGLRAALPVAAYAVDLLADGTGRVRLLAPVAGAIAVRLAAGIAPDWAGLPDGLRHGVIRLAAHGYRQRDEGAGAAAPAALPAAVAALWRPWRRMRLC